MTRAERLKGEIKELAPSEFAAFRQWFQDYDAAQWDKQIEEEVIAGKFDQLAKKTLEDHKAGRTKEI